MRHSSRPKQTKENFVNVSSVKLLMVETYLIG